MIHNRGRAISDDERQELQGVSKADIRRCVQQYVREQKTPKSSKDSGASPYPEVKGLPNAYNTFQLHHGGLPEGQRQRALAVAKSHHAKYQATLLGYQCNQNLHFQGDFGSYLNIHTNNIGDAFTEGTYTLNSKFMERAVLDYYAELWHAPFPHANDHPESYWGYCLTMGSTEGTMYGMWNARDYLCGKKILVDDSLLKVVKTKQGTTQQLSTPRLVYHSPHKPPDVHHPNAFTPIVFFSEDTHYSLTKTVTMLEIRTFYAEGMENFYGMCPLADLNGEWPAEVPSHESGAIDLDALAQLVEFFASKGYPIIVCFNYGSTFKGAYDDVAGACNKLQPILEKYNLLERPVHYDEYDESKVDMRTGYWFHVDGALGATYMPYVEMAYLGGLIDKRGPIFDFRLPMVHSIATSGHKWIGAPYPCGVFMTKTKFQMLPLGTPDVIGTPDTTFAGSRNALSPMLLWDYLARTSYEDQVYKALHLEQLATYVENRLLQLQDVLQEDLYVDRTPLALTICFKRANDDIGLKYTLSNEEIHDRLYSHIFMMEHVTHKLIDALIDDLSKPGAFVGEKVAPIDPAEVEGSVPAQTGRKVAVVPSKGRGFQ